MNRQPNVVVLAHPLGAGGGVASFTDQLAEHLRPCARVTTLRYGSLYPALTAPGREERRRRTGEPGSGGGRPHPVVEASRGPCPYLPWTWLRFTRSLAARRPDLVVVQWWHPLFAPFLLFAMLVSRLAGAPRWAVVCHNALPHDRFPLARLLTRLTLRRADELLCLSSFVAADLSRLLGGRRARVLPHPPNISATGADGPALAPVPRAPGTPPVILFFGHVRPYKGLADLVEALPLVEVPVPPLLLAAGPFYEPLARFRAMAERLGVGDRVIFEDRYVPDEEVAELFRAVDVVALPYRRATQSGVIALAAEFARPVVTTGVGGLAEQLGPRARVVPPGSPRALARALSHALAAPPPPPPRQAAAPGWSVWVATLLDVAAAAAQRRRSQYVVRAAGAVAGWAALAAVLVLLAGGALRLAHTGLPHPPASTTAGRP